MNKSWKIRNNAKWLLLVVYVFLVVVGYSWFAFRLGGDSIGGFQEALLWINVLLIPFSIVLLIVIPYWILRKKVPSQITIDVANNSLKICYNSKKSVSRELDKLGFFVIQWDSFNVLVFYKKIQAKRGHFVYSKIISVVGMTYSFGWTSEKLNSIAECLRELQVDEHAPKKKGTLLGYLIE